MSENRLDGLKRLITRFHAASERPGYARGLLSAHDRLGELDLAYAALEESGEVVRSEGATELVMDEFGQRHLRPRFVSARAA